LRVPRKRRKSPNKMSPVRPLKVLYLVGRIGKEHLICIELIKLGLEV
jgi:hypothetical protein